MPDGFKHHFSIVAGNQLDNESVHIRDELVQWVQNLVRQTSVSVLHACLMLLCLLELDFVGLVSNKQHETYVCIKHDVLNCNLINALCANLSLV
jgi:hypothetical protein